MDQATRAQLSDYAVEATIAKAFTDCGVVAGQLLMPHVRSAIKVEFVNDSPRVTATDKDGEEISVEKFVKALSQDAAFAPAFRQPEGTVQKRVIDIRDIGSCGVDLKDISSGAVTFDDTAMKAAQKADEQRVREIKIDQTDKSGNDLLRIARQGY